MLLLNFFDIEADLVTIEIARREMIKACHKRGSSILNSRVPFSTPFHFFTLLIFRRLLALLSLVGVGWMWLCILQRGLGLA